MRSHLLKNLLEYKDRNPLRLHMPGHKGKDFLGGDFKDLEKNLYSLDLTEIEGMDDLSDPKGFLKDSLRDLSISHSSKKSYMLTNGSSSGVTSSLFFSLNRGERVLLDRGSHKSCFRALEFLEAKALFPDQKFLLPFNIPLPLNEDDLERALQKNDDIRLIFLTQPNYFGISYSLKDMADKCKEKGIMMIVDEAHGSHLDFAKDGYPASAISMGAHISIQSYHKNIPSLTQTAVLHLGEDFPDDRIKDFEKKLDLLTTSSPSYIFMASIDIAREYMEERGSEELYRLKESLDRIRGEDFKNIRILKKEDLPKGYELDPSKITLYSKKGGGVLEKLLREENIEIEFSMGPLALLIFTVADSEEDIAYFKEALIRIDERLSSYRDQDYRNIPSFRGGSLDFSTVGGRVRKIPFKESIGRVSAEDIIPYPPGSPLILAGERINEDKFLYLSSLIEAKEKIYSNFLPDFIEVFDY